MFWYSVFLLKATVKCVKRKMNCRSDSERKLDVKVASYSFTIEKENVSVFGYVWRHHEHKVHWFSSLHKNQRSKFQFDWIRRVMQFIQLKCKSENYTNLWLVWKGYTFFSSQILSLLKICFLQKHEIKANLPLSLPLAISSWNWTRSVNMYTLLPDILSKVLTADILRWNDDADLPTETRKLFHIGDHSSSLRNSGFKSLLLFM